MDLLIPALADLTLFVGLGWYIVLLVSTARGPYHQGLHDRLAGSLVTR